MNTLATPVDRVAHDALPAAPGLFDLFVRNQVTFAQGFPAFPLPFSLCQIGLGFGQCRLCLAAGRASQ